MNSPLHGPAKALRLAAIGAVMLAAGAGFAYAAGWLGEPRLTPQRIIDTFEAQAGHYPGYRKNHAKGLCVSGWDILTCLLCTAPAGLSQITVFAEEIGADSFTASVFHTVRILSIVSIYPWLVLWAI